MSISRVLRVSGIVLVLSAVAAADTAAMPLAEFIAAVTGHDSRFEEILSEQLSLRYQADARLPAADLIAEIKTNYAVFLPEQRYKPQTGLSLSKLFNRTGTRLSVAYTHTPADVGRSPADIQALIAQPIAANAFSRNTRRLAELVGVEQDIARFEIVEAYEDYLAALLTLYAQWNAAAELWRIAESSAVSNQRLQDNIAARQARHIALPVDVSKVQLSVLAKQEAALSAEHRYQQLTQLIARSTGQAAHTLSEPAAPRLYQELAVDSEPESQIFFEQSRTAAVLRLLDRQHALSVRQAADELLPAVDVEISYRASGQTWQARDPEQTVFAGLALQWPFPAQRQTAAYHSARAEQVRNRYRVESQLEQLQAAVTNLGRQIAHERRLLSLTAEKIRLAAAVAADEEEQYSFGRVSLNDYIAALNVVDQYSVNAVQQQLQTTVLAIEWLRLTDRLVDQTVLRPQPDGLRDKEAFP